MVHGYIVYTKRAETAAVSRGTSHVTIKQRCECTTWVDIQNTLSKAIHSFRTTRDKSAVSLLESVEYRYMKATNNRNNNINIPGNIGARFEQLNTELTEP